VHRAAAGHNIAAAWPALAARLVEVGGVRVSYAEAVKAAAVLAASRTSAIAPVLRAAGSPLAACDYFAVAAPHLAAARRLPKTGRIGAAGRHVTKIAFLAAVETVLARALADELAGWESALATDERYAAAIARDAVTIRQRAHAAGIRSSVRSAVARAVAACNARRGQFTCSEPSACGTGSCRFAAAPYAALDVPAPPGRVIRPFNHASRGEGFSADAAADQLVQARPWRAGVPVSDCAA
jgi:hypothetical protein